ncbi:MAG TPA: PaaI family thioesterase, partial [Oscillospiraceae bacterium]|nr:PaaI family thioesterase [Oscillospiraceae bacterium]
MKSYSDLSKAQHFVDTRDSFAHLLGLRIVDCTEKGVVSETPLRPEFCNPHGIAHGGFLYAIADTTCGMTTALAMPGFTPDQRIVTAVSSFNFLAPATHSPVRAE